MNNRYNKRLGTLRLGVGDDSRRTPINREAYTRSRHRKEGII